MIPTERPLDNPINWSFRLTRVAAIDVRVHILFLLAAAVVVWMELPPRGSGLPWSVWQALADGLGTYAILFCLVLLHEFGHCYGARSVGGTAREILLWPLGGLAYVRPPHDPRAHLITAMSGPTVNVAVCAICSGIIAAWMGSIGAVPWNPLHPTLPADPTIIPTTGQMWLLRVFGISYFLLLINMLPIFPFDGGRMVQAWLWQRKGYRASIELTTAVGMVAAIALGLFALFADQGWLLLMVAIFGYVTCWQARRAARERQDLDMADLGYEPGGVQDGPAAIDLRGRTSRSLGGRASSFGFLAHRRLRRAMKREQQERVEHEARFRAVENTLRKIAQSGIDSLTPVERRLLEQETHRRRAASTDAIEREFA